jgi:hypothetical protein
MSRLNIKYLASGGVIVNYNCVSRCGHCLYNCSPGRSKDYLDEATAGCIFQHIGTHGCRSVHIGGGEPLLQPKKLAAVAAAARQAGLGIDYIETNSAWFVDSRQAVSVLEELRGAGVHALLVSISPFHNAHIPYSRVRGVIDACRQSGMQVFPWVNAFVRDLIHFDQNCIHDMNAFEDAYGPGYLQRIPDRYWIHLGGRALETFRSVLPQHTVADVLEKSPSSCARALGDTSHFHIDLYGNFIPGLCAGLAIEMEDLGKPLPEGKYPLLEHLADRGIRGLYEMANQLYGYSAQRNGYLNHCDLCTEIRSCLIRLDGEFFRELAPAGFYTPS